MKSLSNRISHDICAKKKKEKGKKCWLFLDFARETDTYSSEILLHLHRVEWFLTTCYIGILNALMSFRFYIFLMLYAMLETIYHARHFRKQIHKEVLQIHNSFVAVLWIMLSFMLGLNKTILYNQFILMQILCPKLCKKNF